MVKTVKSEIVEEEYVEEGDPLSMKAGNIVVVVVVAMYALRVQSSCCCCCCSHVSIVAYGHGEFEVLLTPTEWVKVHAPQKFLQLSVDPHTSWNLLNYYLTLAIEYWQVCTLCHST